MLNDQGVEPRTVLVELSVIPLGGNGQTSEQVEQVLKIVDETGLFHVRTPKGTCIEGEWNDISSIIYTCYEQVQQQSPLGFLRVSIR